MAANFGTSGTGNFAASPASRPQAMRDLLQHEAVPAWWYIHHPARWQLHGDEWVPWLTELRADPGVNRVDKDGNTDLAEVQLKRKGWTVIPWDVEPGGYCIAYEGVSGPVHLSKWQSPKLVAGQTRIQSDAEGYWAFCRRLVAEGYITKPDPDFIDVIIERQTKKVQEFEERSVTNPNIMQMLPVERATLERMIAAKERLYAEPAEDAAPAKRVRK